MQARIRIIWIIACYWLLWWSRRWSHQFRRCWENIKV